MKILNSQRAFEHLKPCSAAVTEEFWALALSSSKTFLERKMLFRGTVDSCMVHPRDLFRFACLQNASALIIAHNHPHGDRLPSQQDISLTRNLVSAGKLLEIPILDHLVVTKESYFSFADFGLMGSVTP